jgi:ADP-ribose pyrophosphatase
MYKKIPDNAKLVFKGVRHDVYQWDQEMFDGSTAVFEAIKRQDSVTIVTIVGDKIMVNNEEQPGKPPFRALPGGELEEGQTPLENAKRELLEETGYSSDTWEAWFVSDVLKAGTVDWNNHFFIARNARKTHEPQLDAGEKIEVMFMNLEEFIEFRNNPRARNKDLFPILEKAADSEEEKEKLKTLLFGTK